LGIHTADVFGTVGITFVIILVNCGFERALPSLDAWHHSERDARGLWTVALSAVLLLADFPYGHAALRAHRPEHTHIRIASRRPSIVAEIYRERREIPPTGTMAMRSWIASPSVTAP